MPKKVRRYLTKKLMLAFILATSCNLSGCSSEEKNDLNYLGNTLIHGERIDKLNMEKLDNSLINLAQERQYDYISDYFFVTKGGQRCRYVSVANDSMYEYGWIDEKTKEEIIPCGKYKLITNLVKDGCKVFNPYYYALTKEGDLDFIYFDEDGVHVQRVVTGHNYDAISDMEFEQNGHKYRYVSVANDIGYKYGWLNLDTYQEDIPCQKYDYIGPEFYENGNYYRKVSVPHDNGYAYGWLNMTTFNEDVSPQTYKYIDKESDPDYYLGIKYTGVVNKLMPKVKTLTKEDENE